MSALVHHMTRLVDTADGPLKVLTSGKGIRVQDSDGVWYIDALSGLYNVNVGYGRVELGEVAAREMGRLGFGTLFFGRATDSAMNLADKLAAISPQPIARFFLTLGGSDAVDSAIKLVRHANILDGKPGKMKIVARRDSYHGMTLAATTATGQASLRRQVGPLVPGVIHVEQPSAVDGRASARELEDTLIREDPATVAAFIGEPISVPPGVNVPADDYWPEIQAVCRRYGVRVIADEVITGFGRTGKWFASEHWGIKPDLMIMSKGLSSGYVPIGAVGLTEELLGLLRLSDPILPHGFTTGGHPTCCAVALENISILEREDLISNAAAVGDHLALRLDEIRDRHRAVTAVRSKGMLAAIDVPGAASSDQAAASWLVEHLDERRLLTRSYGPSIVLAPPLVSTPDDIDKIAEILDDALTELARVHPLHVKEPVA